MRTLAAGSHDARLAGCLTPLHLSRFSSLRQRAGFTLLELLVVLAIVAFASAGVGLALRDDTQTRLEREAARLSALLEAARAQAQVSGVALRWRAMAQGFRFEPEIVLAEQELPLKWLDPDTRAEVLGPANGHQAQTNTDTLLLGPDPILPPQTVTLYALSQPHKRLRLATDGLRPFALQSETP